MTLSVLTLACGRRAHLANLALGLARQSRPPDELIVAAMDDAPVQLGPLPFAWRVVRVPAPGDLPLAAARNAAAAAASGDRYVCLDVDCIPGPDCLADYDRALGDHPGAILMGEVGYLPSGCAAPGWRFADFEAAAVRHSDRQGPPPEGVRRCEDYRCFWSLNFALTAESWRRAGGFDPRYAGYGGEDTDFAKAADRAGIPLAWLRGGRAFHQYHPHHMPPVHHIDSILRNCAVFREKWGYGTMGHWLHAFELMGLIEKRGQGYVRRRGVSDADLAFTRQDEDMPYANTARILRRLKADMGRQLDEARAREGVAAG